MNLLHISSSPRGTDSESLRIAKVFTDTYAESHPGAVVDHWASGTLRCPTWRWAPRPR
jgi:FMN-dependent NADH-azoreductase